jgi:hypothetical protein
MTHQDAVEELAVEQYLLGELAGDARDRFEEHLFECQECAADLKQGVQFMEAARVEFRSQRTVIAADRRAPRKSLFGLSWLAQPWVLAPALAACLAVIVYQSAVLLPHMHSEIAESQTPTVLAPLVLANAGARGGSADAVPEIKAPRHGFYLLSVDIPPAAGASAYRCTLYSPAGAPVWHVDVSPQQAHDAVTIQVPVMTTDEGINELRVQEVAASGSTGENGSLATYKYRLSFLK